jgi:hypothetical protein
VAREGQKPVYALTKILDATVDPIQRVELGDNDPKHWLDPEKDPWVPCTVLPLFDSETRQVFILIAAYGGRSETSSVISTFADNAAQHPEAEAQLPIVQLCVRQYPKSDGDIGYAMALDIDGWADRPAAVLHVQPPALSITSEVGKSGETDAKAKPAKSDGKADAKPKRKISVLSPPDPSIPF